MLRKVSLVFGLMFMVWGCDSPPTLPPLPDAGDFDAATLDAGGGTPVCDNGMRDGDETGLDCGGSCPPCADGDMCRIPDDCESGVCMRGRCLVPNCMDGVRNGLETGADCGGDCGLCPGGEPCTSNDQCLSGRCRGGMCTMSNCEDDRLNGEETDVDCGGSLCPPCAGGLTCDDAEDCSSLICSAGVCTDAACNDGVQNQDETSVDCGGGICLPCRDGLACDVDADCEGMRCFDGGCVSCMDGIMDAEETDVDCGGGLCDPCEDGEMCVLDSDCSGETCESGLCVSCTDGVQNQDETDVDCGGSLCPGCADTEMCLGDADCGALGATCVSGVCASCADSVMNRDETDVDCGGPTCPACRDRLTCSVPSDCMSNVCESGTCVSCMDGVVDQDETDIDCGGSICPACTSGRMCLGDDDCASMICDDPTGLCNAPGCGDSVLNGMETDLDCGGGDCIGCADGLDCVVDRDCLSGVCDSGTCQVPTCSDGVFNGDETDVDCGGPTPPGCPRCVTGRRCDATSDCATDMCDMGYCGGAAMCRTAPARVLVYQPGGTTPTTWFPAGTMVDVASDAMWRSLSTADFGRYDIIFIGGGNCGGSLDSLMGTAEDTVATWGPAVRGRILISADDADFHGGPQAMLFFNNVIEWLKTPGANVDAGRTSLYMSWGCTMNSGYMPGIRGTPERFVDVLGMGVTGERQNYCSSVAPTAAGTSHPLLAGIAGPPASFWGCPFHGGFPTLPPGYVSITDGTTGPMSSVLAYRDSPMPCIP